MTDIQYIFSFIIVGLLCIIAINTYGTAKVLKNASQKVKTKKKDDPADWWKRGEKPYGDC